MNIEDLRSYCIQKPFTEESFPFDSATLVFKVAGKIFLLVNVDGDPLQFNIKCDPEKAVELREQYDCVLPGFHMNKKHWNTIVCDGTVQIKMLKQWIDDSYELIVDSLPKKVREQIKE